MHSFMARGSPAAMRDRMGGGGLVSAGVMFPADSEAGVAVLSRMNLSHEEGIWNQR